MQVLLTPEAAALLESRKSWWRANRPATAELFEREFLDAVALIAERPALLPVAIKIGGREIHRVLMEKTSCHSEVTSADRDGAPRLSFRARADRS